MTDKTITKLKIFYYSPWFIIAIFSLLGLIGILNHAMWRDEMNTWLIVRDSESWQELLYNIKCDRGHSGLWHLSLALLRNIADTPVIMQLFHLILGIITISLFWLYSPFSRLQKILFTFSFYPFYEYLLISRNYAIGICLLFVFCAAFETRHKTYLILAIILGLMSNANIYIMFVAVALAFILLLDFCLNKELQKLYLNKRKFWDLILSSLIIISFFGIAIYFTIPPADNTPNILGEEIINFDLRHLFKVLGRVLGGYALIIPSSKRWLDLIICGLIASYILLINCIYLWKKSIPLTFYVFAHLEIFIFIYVKHLSDSMRHLGHYYFIMITALWLASYYQENKDKLVINFQLFKFDSKKWHYSLLMIILYIQLLGGIYSFGRDLIVPFSASRETAHYILESHLENEFIVASRDVNMAALSGYLNRKLYYPELKKKGSFFLFSQRGFENIPHDRVLKQIKLLFQQDKKLNKIILILHKKLKIKSEELEITPIKNFTNSYINDEKFYLYSVRISENI